MNTTVEMLNTQPVQEQDSANTQNKKPAKDEGHAIVPIPDDVQFEAPHLFSLGRPVHFWTYKDQNGKPLFFNCRFQTPEGKQDRPVTYRQFEDGHKRFAYKALDPLRPLYGLDRLAERPADPVIVCEGEKATDAAQILFPDCVAITSPNGAKSAHQADWSPIAGRQITIWPDHDKAGAGYAEAVVKLARQAGAASVVVVAIPEGFPEAWDLADTPPEGITIDELLGLKSEAKEPVIPVEINPLDDLLKNAEADPGSVFKPDVIEALLNLKTSDRAAFETLRSKLKKLGVRVGELDKLIRGQDDFEDEDSLSQADILIALATRAELFHAPDGTAFANFEVNEHRETWPARSKGFKRWLTRQFHLETGKAPNSEAMNAALNTIDANAYYNAPEQPVAMRVGSHGGKHYIDLCNPEWQVIEIDEAGWRIIDTSPVRFRRTSGMLPLPTPQQDGSIEDLRKFLNVRSDHDFKLTVMWLLASMRDTGPYPLLALSGEQGSAKTTFSILLKRATDPNTSPLRVLPSEDDLYIAANNGHVQAFDNLSYITPGMADALCRLSTGGGYAKRQLYSDMDEILFNVMRPIILNGITEVVTRPDLADRAIILTLEAISEDKRQTEHELMAAFDLALPGILGALLNAMVHGIRVLPGISLKSKPRMADFALWGAACEGAFSWPAGSFMQAYEENRAAIVDSVLEANPVAFAVQSLVDMGPGDVWKGTAAQLLQETGDIVGESIRRSKSWPKTPRGLTEHLKRSVTFLRKTGINIEWDRDTDKNRTRKITISWLPDNESIPPSGPSA